MSLKTDPSGSSGENSSDPNTVAVFEYLKCLNNDTDYQDALKVMHEAPDEYKTAFTTIIQKGFSDQPQAPVLVPPPAAVTGSSVKAFLLITGQTHGADQQILDQLNRQGLRVSPTVDPQQSDVILLFCPILSRVRSDMEAAFRKIPDGAEGKPVILVLLHHTRKVEQVLKPSRWKEEFPNVTLEVQVLYHETQNGLLQDCPRNQEAIQTLLSLSRDLQTPVKTDPKTRAVVPQNNSSSCRIV